MGMVGKEVIQSRSWIDPKAQKPPNLNYKYIYPITVYEAVKENMDDDAKSLGEELNQIHSDIKNKQPIFSAKPANYIMTFAGEPGAVGSIAMTREIPWDPTQQRHDRIPTEKAVGDLLLKLGLVDKNGNIDPNGGTKVDWENVIGRPNIYDDIGMNVDGFITQKGITLTINSITDTIDKLTSNNSSLFKIIGDKVDSHISNKNNPHGITIDQISGVSKDAFEFHTGNTNNPHNVTKVQIGLENVDNTSDTNKPVSKATQGALDIINKLISDMNSEIGNSVIDGKYDQPSGILTLIFKNGNTLTLNIPINGLIDEIQYNKDTKELFAIELGGHINKIDVSDLFIRYIGGITSNITIKIDDTKLLGTHMINASINPESITDSELANDSVITRIIKNQSVTTDKINDLSVTTIKLSDNSVTTEKIAQLSVTTEKINDRAVIGKKLFSSGIDNRILGVLTNGSDPAWMQIVPDMISDNAVHTIHISSKSVTSDKLDDKSVVTNKLDDSSVSTVKLADFAVTNDKISNGTITGTKLTDDILLPGIPKIEKHPDELSNDNQITDAFWVTNKLDKAQMKNDNIIDRAIDGRTLFSSSTANRILGVIDANSNPLWTTVNNSMIDDNAIHTNNIMDLNITDTKLADSSIKSRHITNSSILTDHIKDGEVTSKNIWPSDKANKVLASLVDNGHPVYTSITRDMIVDGIIGTDQMEDRSITLSKLVTSSENNRILGVVLKNSNPIWMQVINGMIGNRSVDGRTLFTSPTPNKVLTVTASNMDPSWSQVNGDMIADRTIAGNNIADGAIINEHLQDKIVKSNNIDDHTITSNNIAPKAITGSELFTSPIPNRVLAVTSAPYSIPSWMQVSTDMISDKAITREKMFQADYDYRVLGATKAGVPPEYLKITSDFIVDGSIIPQKLVPDLLLYGTPEMTDHAPEDADNKQIADTYWVRKTVANMIKDFNPKILFDTIDSTMIQDRAIGATKLFSSSQAPRVLGVTYPNADPEYILIEEDLIVDSAVTTRKLQKDITLLGSPTLEVRPFATASDSMGGGSLIPDCQWVLDTINAANKISKNIYKFDSRFFIISDDGISLNVPNMMASLQRIDDLINHPSSDPIFETEPAEYVTVPTISILRFNSTYFSSTARGLALDIDNILANTKKIDNIFVDTSSIIENPESISYLVIQVNSIFKFDPDYFIETTDGITLNIEYMVSNNVKIDALFHDSTGSDPSNPGGSTGGTTLSDGSVCTEYIANRAVTGDKLFSSVVPNRLLGVFKEDSSPQYLQANNEMISDRAINGRTLFTSVSANKILGVVTPGDDPSWMLVNYDMMDKNSIGTNQLRDNIVTNPKITDRSIDSRTLFTSDTPNRVLGVMQENSNPIWLQVNYDMIAKQSIGADHLRQNIISTDKIVDNAVTQEKLDPSPIIDTARLIDKSVTTNKIADQAVENIHIKDHTIQSEKLATNIEFPGQPTVPPDSGTSYQNRALRNTIISADAPTGGQDGDIWLRYI